MENVAGEQGLPLQKLFHTSFLLSLAKLSHSKISDMLFSISVMVTFYFMKVYQVMAYLQRPYYMQDGELSLQGIDSFTTSNKKERKEGKGNTCSNFIHESEKGMETVNSQSKSHYFYLNTNYPA